MTEMIENKTFEEIQIGDGASLTRVLRPEDVETWAAVTGNVNLLDLDPTPIDSSMFRHSAARPRLGHRVCRYPLSQAGADPRGGDRHRHGQGQARRRGPSSVRGVALLKAAE